MFIACRRIHLTHQQMNPPAAWFGRWRFAFELSASHWRQLVVKSKGAGAGAMLVARQEGESQS